MEFDVWEIGTSPDQIFSSLIPLWIRMENSAMAFKINLENLIKPGSSFKN